MVTFPTSHDVSNHLIFLVILCAMCDFSIFLQKQPASKTGASCGVENEFGPCDAGSVCGTSGTCDSVYKEDTTVCFAAQGCCDAAEYCTGSTYNCPDDVKKTFGTICRETCEDCVSDPSEVCDGVSNTCPDNTILKESICIYAGQHNEAGTVALTASPIAGSSDYRLCAEMTLLGWTLQQGANEAIKIEFSTDGVPESNPGKYSIKYPSSDISQTASGIFEYCMTITGAEVCPADGSPKTSLSFALHFDVENGESSETAWALPCKDSTAPSAFTASPFLNRKGKARGWGNYFVWEPCCPDECPDCKFGNIFSR